MRSCATNSVVIPGRRVAAGPESITTIVSMDSAFAPRGAPRNDEGELDCIAESGRLRELRDLVGPHLEADQRVRPESLGDRNVGGIAPLRDQHAADPGLVVAGIEGVPAAVEIGLEPTG